MEPFLQAANLGYGILYENDGTNRVNNTLNNYGTISATSCSFADGIKIGRLPRQCLILR